MLHGKQAPRANEGRGNVPRISDPRLVRLLVVSVVGVLFLAGLGIALALANGPDAVKFRGRGIQTMRTEIAAVPPPPDSSFIGDEIYDAPLKSLAYDTYYSLPPGGCSAVQAYYQPRLESAGWSRQSPIGSDLRVTEYSKQVSDYHLVLSVDCNQDGSYTVDIVNH